MSERPEYYPSWDPAETVVAPKSNLTLQSAGHVEGPMQILLIYI